MKTLLALSLIFIFTGCGKTLSIAPEFQSTVDEFNQVAAQHGHNGVDNLIVEFGQTSNKNAGATCYQDSGTPRVAVDEKTWNSASDKQRKEMMFHELGHCVLNRSHTEGRMADDNCKTSIMSASPVGEWCMNKHADEYMTELFN